MVKSKKKSGHPEFFTRIILIIVLVILLSFTYVLKIPKITRIVSPIPKILAFNFIKSRFLTPTPSPTRVPTPTLTPNPTATPTPTPLPGYCLYVPTLLYHHIQPSSVANEKGQSGLSVDNGIFEQQMAYLNSHGYTTITALQLITSLVSKSPLPGKPIVITIDDGYRDIFDYAYPLIQRYKITVNLAIPAGLMEGSNYLTWGQIREMAGSGLVYYMNHTWSHYSLGRGDEAKIRYEIDTANQLIEQNSGQKINIFVYPYGTEGGVATRILREKGFAGAFSTISGYYQCDSFILSLHRNRIGNSSLPNYGL